MIKLSGYKIIKKIGSGGMGDVFLAEHEKLEKKVAIKSLHKNLATDLSFRERFAQEAKTHSKLDHPNIVKLLDYIERKDGLFLIMEYVDGKQLDEHIKKVTGPIPEKELTTLFSQILDAIGYAHKKGLVHRDIKPSNIMIDKDSRIKVLDFGIAKIQEEEKGLTKTGIQLGTATYMSPEQVNAKKVDLLSDIYSLGVTLYYMAVGKSPYDEETNTFSIQTKIVSETFPKASKSYPGVSERLEKIILKATQKDKKNRYQTCEDFTNDFNTNIITSENNSIFSKHYSSKADNSEKSKLNSRKKSNSMAVAFLCITLALVSVILFQYQNFQSLKKEQKDLYRTKNSLEAKKRTILRLNEQIIDLKKNIHILKKQNSDLYTESEVQSKLNDMLEKSYIGCNKRDRLEYYNHTSQTLRLHIDFMKEDGNWYSISGYWNMKPEANHLTFSPDDFPESDGYFKVNMYRYYITNDSGSEYLYSSINPKYSNICESSIIHIY